VNNYRKIDERGAAREGQRHGQAREKGENAGITGSMRDARCMTEDVPVYLERECTRYWT
jgi:hypothetical protein